MGSIILMAAPMTFGWIIVLLLLWLGGIVLGVVLLADILMVYVTCQIIQTVYKEHIKGKTTYEILHPQERKRNQRTIGK